MRIRNDLDNKFELGDPNEETSERSSAGIDMTPMTDMAFLLLTFFILTTTFNRPQIIQVMMPDSSDSETQQEIEESQTLNILLTGDDQIYWYTGFQNPDIQQTDFSESGIRQVLLQKKQNVEDLSVLVKPSDDSQYNRLVDIIDELNISNVNQYAIVDFTEGDQQLLDESL